MAGIAITRGELTVGELRAAAGRTKDVRAARRMLAIALVLERLCCTDGVRDSSCESSVVAGRHEQTHPPACKTGNRPAYKPLRRHWFEPNGERAQAPWLADDPLAGRRLPAIAVRLV